MFINIVVFHCCDILPCEFTFGKMPPSLFNCFVITKVLTPLFLFAGKSHARFDDGRLIPHIHRLTRSSRVRQGVN